VDRNKALPKQENLAPHEPSKATPGPDRSETEVLGGPELDEFYRKLQPEMRRPKPSDDALATALEVVQRMAAEVDAESAADDIARESAESSSRLCRVCGHRNREGNKFCAMCGLPVESAEDGEGLIPSDTATRQRALAGQPIPRRVEQPAVSGTHHYHHHYHHHYFPAGHEGGTGSPRFAADTTREAEKPRPSAVLRVESMSRAEAAVRRITQEWVLACNTKHLDDLLDLYIPDAFVLRSNYPPVRGAAAIREFFFVALDAGLGDVEIEPLHVKVAGDLAYEAGRCKALIPGAAGKRREERGKYLWVFARQSNGEWKLAADCWSSDLTLATAESDVTTIGSLKPGQTRKSG
jgi:uncharacterized protein (TIGR02246 family)